MAGKSFAKYNDDLGEAKFFKTLKNAPEDETVTIWTKTDYGKDEIAGEGGRDIRHGFKSVLRKDSAKTAEEINKSKNTKTE
jgi:hypothetical protein